MTFQEHNASTGSKIPNLSEKKTTVKNLRNDDYILKQKPTRPNESRPPVTHTLPSIWNAMQ